MKVVPERPQKQSTWRRLKNRLEIWVPAVPMAVRGCFSVLLVASPLLCLIFGLLAACLLLIVSGPLVTGFFFILSRQESLANPIAEIALALLFTLVGLALVLVARRFRLGEELQPPHRGLALLFSKAGNFFWIGSALCAIVAAQIVVPTYARWLSILFWVVAGYIVLSPFLHAAFTFLLRRFRWLFRAYE